MRSQSRLRSSRSRPFVALIVLTAWFGTLLSAAPLQQASAAAVVDPTFTVAPSLGPSTNPTFEFSLNADADPAQCHVVPGTSTVPPTDGWGSCTTGTTFAPTLSTDGDHRIWIRSVNTTTAPDTSVTPTATITTTSYSNGISTPYRLDRVGPTFTLTSAPASPGGSGAVSFVVDTAETPSVGVTCTLTHTPATGATQLTPISGLCQTTAAPFPATPLSQDGSYVLTAQATDAAGNPASSGPLTTFVLDRTGPALTLASGPNGTGNTPDPSWTVTAAGGATVTCQLAGAAATATVFLAFSPCTAYRPGPLTDDTYTLTASATDGSGNTRTGVVATYLLDTARPTITVSPASNSSTTDAAGWTVTVGDGGQAPTCVLTEASGGTFGSGTGCAQFSSFTLPREGSYTLTASTVDDAGNPASATGTWLYRAAPTVSVSTARPTGNTTSNTWTVTAPTTAALTCTLQRRSPTPAATPRAVVPCTAGSVTTPLPDGDGTYRLSASALDAATGATGSSFADFLLDTAPLPPFSVTGTGGDTDQTAVSWAWDATGSDTATCQLLLSDAASGAAVTSCASPWTTPLTSDGAWSLQVTLFDTAGNATVATGPEVRLDRIDPAAPGVTVNGGRYLSNNRTPVWLLTGEVGATYACSWTTDVVPAPSGMPAAGACATGYAPTLPNVSGTYTLTVTQSDAARNTSLPSTKAYQLDVTVPAVTFTGQPRSPVKIVNNGTGTWTTSGETTATSRCTLVQTNNAGTTTLYAGQACGRSIPVTDAGEGSYVLTVVDTDAAGNDSPALVSSPWVIDRTDPGAPSITRSPLSPSQALSATWTVVANDPSASELLCRFVANGDTSGAFSVCGPEVVWSPLAGEGSYRLDLLARDGAGNVSAVVSSSDYIVDLTAPAPAVFTSAAGTGFVTSASWSWTGEAGATAQCLLRHNGVAVPGAAGTFRPCTSPRTETLSAGDGAYTLQVRLTDAALNTNAAVTGPAYDLDTVKPDAPVVTGPSGPSKQRTVTWTYTTTETVTPSLLCQLTRAATATSTAVIVEPLAPCTSLTRTLPALTADGSYVLSLQLKDAAGNLSDLGASNAYLLDTTPPALAVFTSEPAGTSRVQGVNWAWTSDADATAECQLLHLGAVVKAWASCGSPHGESLTYGDGDYQLQVRLTDPVLNTNAPVTSATYTLDRTPPAAPTVSGPTGTKNVTSADYSITSTVESGATAECRLTFETTAGSWTACTLPATYPLTSGDGNYFLEVRLTDRYGNLGSPGPSPTYLLDTKAPTAPSVTAPPSPSKIATPVFRFTSDADVTNSCSLARGPVVVATADPCSATYSTSLTGLADGDYVLTVVSKDAAGNTTTGVSGAYTYDTTAPVAPSVTGPKGPSQNRTPSFTWTAETGSRAECSLAVDAGPGSAFVACSSPYAPLLSVDGTWVLTVRVTDAADNVSDAGASGGYLLDTTAPPAPVVVAPSSPGRDLAPSWGASVEAGAVTECRLTAPGATPGAFAACALPLATPVTADGTYTFEVRATDAAGNVSPIGAGTYVLDTVAPAAPELVDPTGPSRNRAASFSFTAEAGATTSCRVTRGATVLAPLAACVSPHAVDLTGQPDGAYTLSVRATDPAGNVGPAGTTVYVLDTTPPAVPVMTLTAGSPSSDRAPSYAFNYEAGADALCRLVTPGGPRDLACTNAVTLDLAGAADGTYQLQVLARDTAGNVSAAVTTPYVLDSNAPLAPRVIGPVTPGSGRAPTWKISASGPTECRLLRNTTTFKDWAPCGATYLADLFGQPDAVYGFEARLVGSTAATYSRYRLDTTGPAAPALTAPPSPSTTRQPVWAVASAESPATAECRVLLFGAVFQDWQACAVSVSGSLFALDLTGLGDGTYTLAARLTDAAGNVSPIALSDFVLDTSAPSAVGVGAPPSPGNDTTPTWTLTSVTGVLLECKLSTGQQVISDFAPCSTSYTADLTGLPDATYTLTVHALSAAGTPGPETTSSYVLDTTASAAPGTLTGPTGPSRDRAPTWSFVLAPGSTATCRVSSNGQVLRDGPCTSPFTMDLSSAPDGSYTLTVRAIDAAGNVGEPAVAGYVLRTVPAPAPAWTLVPGSPSSSTSPRWGFSTVRSVQPECRRLLDGSVTEDWTPCTSPVTLLLVGKPDGRYTLQVRSVDAAGNTSSPITSDYAFDRTAPPLVSLTDTPASPGNDTTPTWVIGGADLGQAALRRAAALTGTLAAQCRLTTPRGTGAWTPCGGTFTTSTVGDGSYLLEVRAADSTGATGPVTASTYVLDTAQPPVQRFTDEPPPVGNEAVASWSWNDDPLLTVECRLSRPGGQPSAYTACLSPQVVATANREGTYQLELRAVDAAGNIGAVTAGAYRYDRTPPPAPQFTTRPAARGTEAFPTWGFVVPEDTRAVCIASHEGVVLSEGPCSGAFALDLRGQQPGTWSLSVRYVDTAGNVGPSTLGSYTLVSALGRTAGTPPAGFPGGFGGTVPGRTLVPGGLPNGPASLAPQVAPSTRLGEIIDNIKAAGSKAAAAAGRLPVAAPIPGIPPGVGVPDAIKNVINSTITKPQLPLALFVIVLLFLLVQNKIDRRDPKLAAAPVLAEPDLHFGPRVAGPGLTGGATA